MSDPSSQARQLMQEKENIEAQIEVYQSQLQYHGVTHTTPLVDPEGYPRSDIDVWAIRQARASLARLRNDHRAVVDRLGRILELVYARDPDAPAVSVEETRKDEGAGEEGMMNGHAEVVVEERRPIARVNTVASGSPASSAGLEPQDLIIQFGTLSSPPNTLTDIAQLVMRSEGTTLPLTVRRQGEVVELNLTPRTGWGGRGMLGMHILPADS